MNSGHYHLHLRKRAQGKKKKLAPYPHPNPFIRLFDKAMFVFALLGPAAILPQVYEIFVTKNVSGLSLSMWVIWQVLAIAWVLYGFIHRAWPILIAQGAYFILQGIVIIAILAYR
ncbi:hypothetical protein L0Y34_00145 [Candidatus Parcubacteria bacterium]|nr:hypothetical protein [Candidatus Parcubacteria bacterium]